MITTARSRRFPIRACDARRALGDLGAPAELSRWLRGTHGFEVRQDRLACEVRHSVEMDSRPATRIWWSVIGRPLYNELVEDAFDSIARQTGSAVRRPARLTPYARLLRRILAADSRPETRMPADAPVVASPLPLVS